MSKKLESKIKYSDFSKLIKLSDSIKSSPPLILPPSWFNRKILRWKLKHTRLLRKKRMVGMR